MKKVTMILVITLLAASSVFVMACGMSREERRTEFNEWYRELHPPKPKEEDIKKEVLSRARVVSVDVILEQTLEEAFWGFGITEKLNTSLSENETPLTLEQILGNEDLKQQGISLFPPAVQVFEDGTVRMPIPPYIFGFDSSTMPQGIALLGEESAIVPSLVHNAICNTVPLDYAERIAVYFTALANADLEDSWKKEILFEGTAKDLCTGEGEHLLKSDEDKGIVIFKRPSTQVFQVSKEPLLVGSTKEFELGDKLYFARNAGNGKLELGVVIFDGAIKNIQGATVIRFSGEFNPENDGGAVLYYLDDNNKLKAVAFTSPLGPFAVDLSFILKDIDDPPYLLEEEKGAED